MTVPELTFALLTPDRWVDLESLFGLRGAIGGCWCMWWRVKRAEFERSQGEGNRQSMQAIVASGEIPGILAYTGGNPVAWCSVAPREAYPVLDRSPVLKRIDDQRVWSVVCFFFVRQFRAKGLSSVLLKAAVDYAISQGATIIEGYPIEPKKADAPDIYAFTGLVSTFRKVGFVEVVRRSPARPVMRYYAGN